MELCAYFEKEMQASTVHETCCLQRICLYNQCTLLSDKLQNVGFAFLCVSWLCTPHNMGSRNIITCKQYIWLLQRE